MQCCAHPSYCTCERLVSATSLAVYESSYLEHICQGQTSSCSGDRSFARHNNCGHGHNGHSPDQVHSKAEPAIWKTKHRLETSRLRNPEKSDPTTQTN